MERRALTGQALLVASSTVMLACCGSISGNLATPPSVELCVTTDPPAAVVTIDGRPLGDDGCDTVVFLGPHTVAATAEGYQDYAETVELYEDTTLDITMVPETEAP